MNRILSPRRAVCALLLTPLLAPALAIANTVLHWGPGGAGGDGTWNSQEANWWNGEEQVVWSNGATAVFGGEGGAVEVTSSFFRPSGILLTAPHYRIEGATLQAAEGFFVVETAASGVIAASVRGATGVASEQRIFSKQGPEGLRLERGLSFFGTVSIEEGEVTLGPESGLPFDARLELANGAALILEPSVVGVGALGGSGAVRAGGAVDSLLRIWLASNTSSTFGGTLEDDVERLHVELRGTGSQSFSAPSAYTGDTTIRGGATLRLRDEGSIASSQNVFVRDGGRLHLDNGDSALAERIGSTATLHIFDAEVEVTGSETEPLNVPFGSLRLDGNSVLTVNAGESGPAPSVVISELDRNVERKAWLRLVGNGRFFHGSGAETGDRLPPYVQFDDGWARWGPEGEILRLEEYASDPATAPEGSDLRITQSDGLPWEENLTWHSLILDPEADSNGSDEFTVALGDTTVLTLTSGGVMVLGDRDSSIQGGTLRADGSTSNGERDEFLIRTERSLSLESALADGERPTDLVKTGDGLLALSGDNIYSGDTYIPQGTLAAGSDSHLGTGDRIHFLGGDLLATDSFTSSKRIRIHPGGLSRFDTAGYDVAFSGEVELQGTFLKTGEGKLSVPSFVEASYQDGFPVFAILRGELEIEQAVGGILGIENNAIARVSGDLDVLSFRYFSLQEDPPMLGFSGEFPDFLRVGSLSTDHVSHGGYARIQVRVGDVQADVIEVGNFDNYRGIAFDFVEEGLASPAHEYLLMISEGSQLQPTSFTLADDATAAGWDGRFRVSEDGHRLYVSFCSTPSADFGSPDPGGVLGLPEFSFGTGGDSPWQAETCMPCGGGTMLSGWLAPQEANWLEAEMEGPGILTFHWRQEGVVEEAVFRLSVNGRGLFELPEDPSAYVSEWKAASVYLPPGPNTVRWLLANHHPGVGSVTNSRAALRDVSFRPVGYGAWATHHGLDMDGAPDLLAYAFDSGPGAPRPERLPRMETAISTETGHAHPAINFVRSAAASDIDYVAQASSDLEEWTDLGADAEIQVAPLVAGVTERVTILDPLPAGTEDRRFLRVLIRGSEALQTLPSAPSPANMVLIPGGTYRRGDQQDEEDPSMDSSRPVHEVYVSDFYLGETPVTYKKWREVYDWAVANGYDFTNSGRRGSAPGGEPWPDLPENDRDPVVGINWYDAVKWCNAKSERDGLTPVYYTDEAHTEVYRTGFHFEGGRAGFLYGYGNDDVNWTADGYRLPTEAEWEKAARGGLAGQRWPWGNQPIDRFRANYWDDDRDAAPLTGTTPVGSHLPNGFGLYDTAGNVAEWCWDWWNDSWYENSEATESNTRGPHAGGGRVRRGGAWNEPPGNSRVAFRASGGGENDATGFRLARNVADP